MKRSFSLVMILAVVFSLMALIGSSHSPASAEPPLQATATPGGIDVGPVNPTPGPATPAPIATPPPGGGDIGGTPVKQPAKVNPPATLDDLLKQFPDLQPYLDKVKDLTSDKMDLGELYSQIIKIFRDRGATGVAAFLKDSGILDKLNIPLSYLDLLTVYDKGGLEAVAAMARQRKLINDKDEIVGFLALDSKDSLAAVGKDLEALDVSVYGYLPETEEVEIGIPLKTLSQFQTPGTLLGYLTRIANVNHVVGFRGPTGAQQTGPLLQGFESVGAKTIGADKWQAAGITGKGVRVGVLDMGFAGIKGALGKYLPEKVETNTDLDELDSQDNGHGTAVAAVIHGAAPDAELFIAFFDGNSRQGFNDALEWLAQNKVQVINYSAGNLIGPRDGTSVQAQAVTAFVRDTGVLWVNSAGNYAISHSAFEFKPDDKGIQTFGEDQKTLPFKVASSVTSVAMNWNGNWNGKENNEYIFTVLDKDGNEVVTAAEPRRGKANQYPFQFANFESEPGEVYYLVIAKTRGKSDNVIDIIIPNALLPKWAMVPAYSVTTPGDADAVLTVGASGLSEDVLEDYSSRGPTADDRLKPDLSAPTGEKVVGYEDEGFFGTSGAAPLVAGAAALVLQKFPDMTNAEVKAFLIANVQKVDTAPDTNWGAGRLQLPDPGGVDTDKPDPKKATGNDAKATITDLKTKFNVNVKGVKGMSITVSFEVNNYKGKKMAVAALFADDKNNPIEAVSDKYSLSGNLATYSVFDVKRNQTEFNNVALFLPNSEFANIPSGTTSLQFVVGILDLSDPKKAVPLVVSEPVKLKISRK